MSSATESLQDTPTSSVRELQEIAQKSLEQYQIQQLPSPEPSQPSTTPQPTESIVYHSEVPHTSQAPLDILDPFNPDLDIHNIIEHLHNRKLSTRVQGYMAALLHTYSDKIPQLHSAFSAGIIRGKVY